MSATVTQKIKQPRGAATALVEASAADAALPVIFVVSQSGKRANGGVESITQVLENLRRVRPIVVTHLETPATQRWRDAGCEVHAWKFSEDGVKARSALRTNRQTFRLVRETGCRVVHCNDISALWHTAFGARLAGATVILNVRNIKPAAQRYGWRWQLARKISRRQLLLSREMQGEFSRRLGVENGRRGDIEYIYSSVDLNSFSPTESSTRTKLRARLGIDENCFAIGCVAPMDPRKGQYEFIKAAGPLVRQLLPQAKIYFIGDFAPEQNDYARCCREARNELNLNESISFVGFTS